MKMYHNILIASALLLAACGGEQSSEGGSKAVAGGSVGSCTTRAYDEIGGPFELTADSGERMTQEDFKGRPTLVYFGFT